MVRPSSTMVVVYAYRHVAGISDQHQDHGRVVGAICC